MDRRSDSKQLCLLIPRHVCWTASAANRDGRVGVYVAGDIVGEFFAMGSSVMEGGFWSSERGANSTYLTHFWIRQQIQNYTITLGSKFSGDKKLLGKLIGDLFNRIGNYPRQSARHPERFATPHNRRSAIRFGALRWAATASFQQHTGAKGSWTVPEKLTPIVSSRHTVYTPWTHRTKGQSGIRNCLAKGLG